MQTSTFNPDLELQEFDWMTEDVYVSLSRLPEEDAWSLDKLTRSSPVSLRIMLTGKSISFAGNSIRCHASNISFSGAEGDFNAIVAFGPNGRILFYHTVMPMTVVKHASTHIEWNPNGVVSFARAGHVMNMYAKDLTLEYDKARLSLLEMVRE
jgi:hypothetical protein